MSTTDNNPARNPEVVIEEIHRKVEDLRALFNELGQQGHLLGVAVMSMRTNEGRTLVDLDSPLCCILGVVNQAIDNPLVDRKSSGLHDLVRNQVIPACRSMNGILSGLIGYHEDVAEKLEKAFPEETGETPLVSGLEATAGETAETPSV